MKLYQRLMPLYDAGEARAIVRLVLEEHFHLSLADILCGKVNELSRDDINELNEIMKRLETGEPVQYVLGEASFLGHTFEVNSAVLIPRPETEELCRWIMSDQAEKTQGSPAPRVLDIGTGSGCIAVSLALGIPDSRVSAWDISVPALSVARRNAARLHAGVAFSCCDALRAPADIAVWNVVVSNPPYVTESEKKEMARNVLSYEPSSALFVPDDDPLRFYRAIARYAATALVSGGFLYFEINSACGPQTCSMLSDAGFADVVLRNDEAGLPRMVRCRRQ